MRSTQPPRDYIPESFKQAFQDYERVKAAKPEARRAVTPQFSIPREFFIKTHNKNLAFPKNVFCSTNLKT